MKRMRQIIMFLKNLSKKERCYTTDLVKINNPIYRGDPGHMASEHITSRRLLVMIIPARVSYGMTLYQIYLYNIDIVSSGN